MSYVCGVCWRASRWQRKVRTAARLQHWGSALRVSGVAKAGRSDSMACVCVCLHFNWQLCLALGGHCVVLPWK
jgi:hypothetical protein